MSDSPRVVAVAECIDRAYIAAATLDLGAKPTPLDLARQIEDVLWESNADLRRRVEELRDELCLAALAHQPAGSRVIPPGVQKVLDKIDHALDTPAS